MPKPYPRQTTTTKNNNTTNGYSLKFLNVNYKRIPSIRQTFPTSFPLMRTNILFPRV